MKLEVRAGPLVFNYWRSTSLLQVTCNEHCDNVLALCLCFESFIFLFPRRKKNPMTRTKNSEIPTDKHIAATPRLESPPDVSVSKKKNGFNFLNKKMFRLH